MTDVETLTAAARLWRIAVYVAAAFTVAAGILLVAAAVQPRPQPKPAPVVHHVQPLRAWYPAGPGSLTIGV